MRTRLAIALACLAALAAPLAGCGGGQREVTTPTACLQGKDAYLRALEKAPGAVRLEGGTPISECLVENQSPGELANVGEAMVETAVVLNARARGGSTSSGLALGYLLGAAEKGAAHTEGVHAELMRRLNTAARFAPADKPLPLPAVAAYKRGYDAGHANG